MPKALTLPLKEIQSSRFCGLQEALGASRAEMVGLLSVFWHETRQRGLERGEHNDLMRLIPTLRGIDRYTVFERMAYFGYMIPEGAESQGASPHHYVIPDNKGLEAKQKALRDHCRKAGLSSAQKRRAPVPAPSLPKPAAKTAALTKPAALAQPSASTQANADTWAAYAAAYTRKMQQPPIRNAKTNSLIKQFVQRLGAQEAPQVIAFFVDHPNKYYMSRMYQLEMAVKDAESLRTQWANNNPITMGDIDLFDRQLGFERDRQRILAGEI